MDSFLTNHFLYLLCSLFGFIASWALSVVDTVSNWWHAAVCSALSLLPKARVKFPVNRPAEGYHPAVLVTGTSSGIGHDAAVALASCGYTVFAGVRSWEDGARVESDFLDAIRPEKIDRNPWISSSPWALRLATSLQPPSRRRQRRNQAVNGTGGRDSATSKGNSGNSDNGNNTDDRNGQRPTDYAHSALSGPHYLHQRRLRRIKKQKMANGSASSSSSLAAAAVNSGRRSELKSSTGAIVPIILDVASAESVDHAFDKVVAELEQRQIPLVAVVNNAGVTAFGPMDISASSFIDHCMTVNFHGPVRVTQKFMPLLRASSGRIVNISSIMSWLIGPGFGVYCASKAALSAASRAWHYELANNNISVSVLEPGITRTALWQKVESQLETHYARLNGRRPALKPMLHGAAPAALPGDEAVASASPAGSPSRSMLPSEDEAAMSVAVAGTSTDQELYSPMIRRIKTSNELAPIFALPTYHAVSAIMHALTSQYPKSTYRVGWDARLMSLATWVASEETVEWLCRAIGIVSED
ncbi:hypothetical protein LPJ64_004029 [Coemansia asiatica]|uniref:NAD(P)-binding protein n=1 Tax=Coemansia asiatica TaxID=1052880 RepID=A0A9W7XGV8_9FUNG|nr:hypothetical protein LPJ64_004029 [Coemansia asiatica]